VGVCFYLLRALAADTQLFFLNLGNQITFPCSIQIHSTTTSLYLSLIFIFYSFIFHIHRQHCGAPSCLSRIILPFNHFALFLFFFFVSLSLSLSPSPNRERQKEREILLWCLLSTEEFAAGSMPGSPTCPDLQIQATKVEKEGTQ